MKWMAFLVLAAWTIGVAAETIFNWTGSTGAEGYYVYLEPTPIAGAPSQYTVVGESTTTFDATPHVMLGTEYEAWVTAYLTTPDPYESADSNHVRFTPPLPPETITIPGQVKRFIIELLTQ